MKKIAIIGLSLEFFVPAVSFAHTKWFAEGELAPYVSPEPTGLYLFVWAIIAVCVVGIVYYLEQHHVVQFARFRPQVGHSYDRAAATFAMVVGSFLLIAGTHEYLFSPNLTSDSGIPYLLMVLQIGIGLAFLVGVATRTAAIMLGVIWLASIYFSGFVAAIENIWVVSTAVFIAIMGNDYFSVLGKSFFKKWFAPYKVFALSILRIGTGATLLILGLSEKILAPEYGMNFLQHYPWNFMSAIGLPFTNYEFVLSAGSVESLLGLMLVLGITTRLTAIVTAVFFTIPMFILGPIELSGHLPHFAAIVMLILFGNGGKFVLTRKYRDATWVQ